MDEEERVGQISWFLCSSCLLMSTQRESVCCKEPRFLSEAVHSKHRDQTYSNID